jgi:prophage regulatory protein
MVPLADRTIYEMEQRGEFPRRFALSPRCVVWTSRKSKLGWPPADQPQSLARNLPMSGNGDRAPFDR